MVYVIQVCWQLASRIRTEFRPDPALKPVWLIPLLCVQWKTADDGHRNCPKHVEFYSKNKFEKVLHLVGFIIRICNETAGSAERQIYHEAAQSAERQIYHEAARSAERQIYHEAARSAERQIYHEAARSAGRQNRNNALVPLFFFFCVWIGSRATRITLWGAVQIVM